MFALQRGCPATMNVLRAFLLLGDVCYLFYKTGFTLGWVEFKTADAYAKASNFLLPITHLLLQIFLVLSLAGSGSGPLAF
jgi:hypothetical protein